jgi:uncharacterized protein (UPF0332 family)
VSASEQQITGAIRRCQERWAVALDNARASRWNSCATDLYFAAFYAASAALIRRGIETGKHTHTQSEVNRILVKEGLLSLDLGRHYNGLWQLRARSDYELELDLEEEEVEPLLDPTDRLIERLIELARS